ncbi:purine-cytosine permease-like protein [Mesorhizobium soli]|nr:hypothetical protein [Mesorhizobium soli]MDH6233158.1 purine-cytosine permease-like protein [Mesorhizobium soli]
MTRPSIRVADDIGAIISWAAITADYQLLGMERARPEGDQAT